MKDGAAIEEEVREEAKRIAIVDLSPRDPAREKPEAENSLCRINTLRGRRVPEKQINRDQPLFRVRIAPVPPSLAFAVRLRTFAFPAGTISILVSPLSGRMIVKGTDMLAAAISGMVVIFLGSLAVEEGLRIRASRGWNRK